MFRVGLIRSRFAILGVFCFIVFLPTLTVVAAQTPTSDSIPQRIITLAPGATELVFAIGAGDSVVATVDYSDYPSEALDIPRIGNGMQINIEQLLAYQPDLVIIWSSGTPKQVIQQLNELNLNILEYKTSSFDDVFSFIEQLSDLLQIDSTDLLHRHKARLQQLKQTYSQKKQLSVFYQLWAAPLMTTNKEQLVSQMISFCGGVNIFANLPHIAPQVSRESVIAADPDVILTAGEGGQQLKEWQKWQHLKAVKNQALYTVTADWVSRASLRSLDGLDEICRKMDRARRYQK